MNNLIIRLETEKDYRAVEELTREVRAHNNFASRVPVMEEQIKAIKDRVNDLEKGA